LHRFTPALHRRERGSGGDPQLNSHPAARPPAARLTMAVELATAMQVVTALKTPYSLIQLYSLINCA
jgi:hypothetical protein